MKAKPGDRIVIAPTTINGVVRDGEVLEARGPDGTPPFRVRWSDGHEGIIYPGVGATIHGAGEVKSPAPHAGGEPRGTIATPAESPASALPSETGPAPARVRDWTVRVSIFEAGDDTDAHVVLLSDAPTHLTASGHSHRGAKDSPVPEIGDEVAVARALRHLADELLSAAEMDIETLTGERDVSVKGR